MAPIRVGLLVLASLVVSAPAFAQDFPELTGRVVDEAGLLSAPTEADLTAKLAAEEAATSNQIVVVTLPDLGGYDIADYGSQLGRHWGIGQEGKDNGAMLIVARDDRKVRIEVGYGLEGALTDARSKIIIENVIVPAFKDGDFERGIRNGVQAILAALNDEAIPADIVKASEEEYELPVWAIILILIAVVAFISLSFAFQTTGGGSGGTWTSGGGGFSGGGGGFSGGGGSFGGGGASGGW